MLFLIFIFLGFCGFFSKSRVLLFLQIIFLYILIAFNKGGPDYNAYEQMYEFYSSLKLALFSKGGAYANEIYYLNKLGLNFSEITIVLSTISIVVMIYLFKKKCIGKYNFVFACVYFYPSIDYIVQKRNFYAMVFLYIGIWLWLKNRKIFAIISIFCSYMHHESFIIYIPIILISLFNEKNLKKLVNLLFLIEILSFVWIDKIFLKFFSKSKVELYLLNLNNRLEISKVGCFIIFHLIMFFIIRYIYKYKSVKNKYDILIFKLNYILLLIIPLYYYNSTFFRIYRNIYFLNYIFIANNFCGILKNKKIIKRIIISYLIGLHLIMYLLAGNLKYKGLVKPLFEKNLVIEKLRID